MISPIHPLLCSVSTQALCPDEVEKGWEWVVSRTTVFARCLVFTLGLLVLGNATPSGAQIPAGDPIVNIWPGANTPVVPTIYSPGVFDSLPGNTLYLYFNSVFQSAFPFGAWSGTQAQTLQTFPYAYTEPVCPRTNGYVIRFNSNSPTICLSLKDASTAFRLMVDGAVVAQVTESNSGSGNLMQYLQLWNRPDPRIPDSGRQCWISRGPCS